MSGDAGVLPECDMNTPITPPSTCAALGRVKPVLVGLNTGCHEKAPVRCPCSRLTPLHDAPQTCLLL